ncbi:hypothetical protein NX773_07805 [Massilia solisilvae]|uniref:Uncharacterized protein n=1 Tax=Massilia solisilvae TaxID=1811225 RepID=A0ABT2BHS0_9BURK|nr:hypothetical protein [Massilia solisilvae]MCS0608065.1 hypothetical protein [Massilia solisilvae]
MIVPVPSYAAALRALTAAGAHAAHNRGIGNLQENDMSGNRSGNSGQPDPSTTLGVGGPTSGEAGSTPTHETMAETGGSGGAGLTRNDACQAAQQEGQPRQPADSESLDTGRRGFQDTRSEQAGPKETGLGTPETGANQEPVDLERQGKPPR